MSRYVIRKDAQKHIDAYLEYRMVVGDADGGTLMSEEEYEAYKRQHGFSKWAGKSPSDALDYAALEEAYGEVPGVPTAAVRNAPDIELEEGSDGSPLALLRKKHKYGVRKSTSTLTSAHRSPAISTTTTKRGSGRVGGRPVLSQSAKSKIQRKSSKKQFEFKPVDVPQSREYQEEEEVEVEETPVHEEQPASLQEMVLEDEVEKLSKQLEQSSLSQAKKYAVKKQMQMKKAELIKLRRKLNSK